MEESYNSGIVRCWVADVNTSPTCTAYARDRPARAMGFSQLSGTTEMKKVKQLCG